MVVISFINTSYHFIQTTNTIFQHCNNIKPKCNKKYPLLGIFLLFYKTFCENSSKSAYIQANTTNTHWDFCQLCFCKSLIYSAI